MKYTVHKKLHKGFTLIELLVVIAVLGVLAAVVMVAIDPGEQVKRGRDAGRKNAVGQLVNAAQSYYTSNNSSYPAENSTWIDTLVLAGELKAPPAETPSSIACTAGTGDQNKYCYDLNTEVVIFAKLESKAENNKCIGDVNGTLAYFLWNSSDGKAGTYCNNSSVLVGDVGTYKAP